MSVASRAISTAADMPVGIEMADGCRSEGELGAQARMVIFAVYARWVPDAWRNDRFNRHQGVDSLRRSNLAMVRLTFDDLT